LSASSGMVRVRTAVVSVSEKQGLVEFVRGLRGFGVEVLSTGGTFSTLKDAGVESKNLQSDMNLPTAVSGRVKTLHAPLQAAILARDTEEHLAELKKMGVPPVDMVVCNFYPFREALAMGKTIADLVESIDIGGPTMVRAASKNFERVTVVPSPKFYPEVLEELVRTDGRTGLPLRRRLAVEAFAMTASYDSAIFFGLGRSHPGMPAELVLSATRYQDAKYGENPDQRAVIYALDNWQTMAGWRQLAGDTMSFNNFLDAGSAYRMVDGLGGTAAVATVKHGQTSGFAFAPTVSEAYTLAHSCDPEADFGGTVVSNSEIDEPAAHLIGRNEGVDDASVYTEIILAPRFSPEAVQILKDKQKKKIRLIQTTNRPDFPYDIKVVEGAVLVQEVVDYSKRLDQTGVTFPTKRKPGGEELQRLLASWEVVRKVQSNGIVIADGSFEGGRLTRFWTLGVASFRKRNGAVKIALDNAGTRARGSVCSSDGFFPFKDSLELLAAAGVSSVIEPGGSVNDSDSVEVADANGMAIVFTHVRAFKH